MSRMSSSSGKLEMVPLRVAWTLRAPMIVPEYLIHLDALLAWAAVDEAGMLEAQEQLPLGRVDGVWQASALRLIPLSEIRSVPMVRRYDEMAFLDAIDQKVTTCDAALLCSSSGRYRAYLMQGKSRWYDIEAWCVGDKEGVARLLRRIGQIGKLRRNSHGKVHTFLVEEDPRALELWQWRVLPAGFSRKISGVDYQPLRHAVSPPYWNPLSRVDAVMPISFPC